MWSNQDFSTLFGSVDLQKVSQSVVIDSRQASKDSIFIGIKGVNYNGSDFAKEALDRGALMCIVDHIPEGVPSNKLLVVPDTHVALQKMAGFARGRFNGKVIGITGSSGKTSVKELFNTVAKSLQMNAFASVGNFNNQYGLPLMLCNLPATADYGIFEIGMNSSGEIDTLAKMLKPDLSIISNIYSGHIAAFNSIQDIAHEKAAIFDHTTATAVIYGDQPEATILQQRASKLSMMLFGEGAQNDLRLVSTVLDTLSHTMQVNAMCFGMEVSYKLESAGKSFALNSLAVLAGTSALGWNPTDVVSTFQNFKPLDGRGRVYNLRERILLIDDSYNANAGSITSSLKILMTYKERGRLVAILGDMRELGKMSIEIHKSLAPLVVECGIDYVITVGEDMGYLAQELPNRLRGPSFKTSAELAKEITNHVQPGDQILVKGSNSLNMRLLVDKIIEDYS